MTSEPRDNAKRGRGRPRDPAAADAVRQATTELLGEEGYQGLTMAGVARRAGVAKTTIYRRWSSKAEMVLDAVAEQLEPRSLDESDDPIDDLRRLTVQFYRRVSGRTDAEVPIAPVELLKEAEIAEVFGARFVDPVREQARPLINRAIDQGRLRPDLDADMLVDALVAPAVFGPLALGTRAEPGRAEKVFEMVMGGALASNRTD